MEIMKWSDQFALMVAVVRDFNATCNRAYHPQSVGGHHMRVVSDSRERFSGVLLRSLSEVAELTYMTWEVKSDENGLYVEMH